MRDRRISSGAGLRIHRIHRLWPLLAVLLLLAFCVADADAYGTAGFPCPEQLTPRVSFWVRIFTEFSRNQRVIHDARYPWIIYDVFDVSGLTQKQIDRACTREKDHYARLLAGMAKVSPERYTVEQQRMAQLLAEIPETDRFDDAKDRIHSQPGVKEQFLLGLRRSGRYIDTIQDVLDSLGAPRELAYLPHVESAFNPGVRSKANALGLWQFTERTGRRFLRIDRDLDERLDPIAATGAAARYLLEAFETLQSWPLAVTAYNHGVGGMYRARSQFGTEDIGRTLAEYEGRYYGFASQNFYCEFLAAIEVAQNAEKYFGPIPIDPPQVTSAIRLDHYVRLPVLAAAFGLSSRELAALNPALGPSLAEGRRPLPKGYVLRIPLEQAANATQEYAAIPASDRLETSKPAQSGGYRVRRGDTLSTIARRHGTSVETLRRLNRLTTKARIFPGQILSMPEVAQSGT